MHSHQISTPTVTPVPDEKVKELSSIAKRHFLISYFEFAWRNVIWRSLISAVFVRWCLRWNQLCNHTLDILQKGISWYPYFNFAWKNVSRWNIKSAVFVRWHLRWNQFCNHTLHTLQKGIYLTFACILWSLKPFSLLPKLLIKLTRFFLTGARQRNYSFLTPSGKKFSDRSQ